MRTVYLVVREPGRSWLPDRPAMEQPAWPEHAAYLETLFDLGHVLFGGPLVEAPGKRVMVVAAESREAVFDLLARDPWTRTEVVRVVSVHTWQWTLDTAPAAA
jgi:uncharacterized protein YciI